MKNAVQVTALSSLQIKPPNNTVVGSEGTEPEPEGKGRNAAKYRFMCRLRFRYWNWGWRSLGFVRLPSVCDEGSCSRELVI